MRVNKTDIIAGLPADVARSIVRLCRGREIVATAATELLESSEQTPEVVFADMAAAGYLKKVSTDRDGDDWWDTTILGNALAMASFGKPISRGTADRLVSGMLERAQEYNADPEKPLFIHRLRAFGSYLDPDVGSVGDVDVELVYGRRITDPRAVSLYTAASGRSFGSYMDQLYWPLRELVQHLKNRSAFISITLEDITRITDRFETIYIISGDTHAAPPPGDAPLIGR